MAIAARFKSAVSVRGSLMPMLVLVSTTTTSPRRTVFSIVKLNTGRASNSRIIAIKPIRRTAIVHRLNAPTVASSRW